MSDSGLVQQGSTSDLEKSLGISVDCTRPGSSTTETLGQVQNSVTAAANPQNVENNVKAMVHDNLADGENIAHAKAGSIK